MLKLHTSILDVHNNVFMTFSSIFTFTESFESIKAIFNWKTNNYNDIPNNFHELGQDGMAQKLNFIIDMSVIFFGNCL